MSCKPVLYSAVENLQESGSCDGESPRYGIGLQLYVDIQSNARTPVPRVGYSAHGTYSSE